MSRNYQKLLYFLNSSSRKILFKKKSLSWSSKQTPPPSIKSLLAQHQQQLVKLYVYFPSFFHGPFFSPPQFELFNELARIFSEDNNASAQRAVLWREGTAKVRPRESFQTRQCFLNLRVFFLHSLLIPSARTTGTFRRCSKSRTCSSVTAPFRTWARS